MSEPRYRYVYPAGYFDDQEKRYLTQVEIEAALNATEAGRELVVLVVRLIETNGSDYSAWQGIKRWLESNPIPEPSAG